MQEMELGRVQRPTSLGTMLLFTIIKVATMTLPGILILTQRAEPTFFTYALLSFLFCLEFLHSFDLYHLQKKERIPTRILSLQLLITISFLVYLYFYSNFYLFILCLCYSITLLLSKVMDYTYFYSFWYTLLQSLFDGFIFNFMISGSAPFYFTKEVFNTFLFSLLLSFLLHFFIQASLNKGIKRNLLALILILFFSAFVYNIYSQFQAGHMDTLKTGLLLAEFLFLFLRFFLKKDFMHKLLNSYFLNLLILATYYAPIFL